MLKYTYNSTRDTLDLTRRVLYALDAVVQVIYIVYMIYRMVVQTGNTIFNIILLTASLFYFIYYLVTTREFYTKKQVEKRSLVKYSVKVIKYVVRVWIVTIALISLLTNGNVTDNMTMLMTLLMMCGIMFSILFDFVIIIIDRKIKLIENAFYYDVENFTINHEKSTFLLKTRGIKLSEWPKVENKKMIDRIKKVHDKQEKKSIRRKDFKAVNR